MTRANTQMTLDQAQRFAALCGMLTYRRPAGSSTERDFIARYILPLGATYDVANNLHVRVNMRDGTRSRVLWSVHTDTVHKVAGRQAIGMDRATVRVVDKRSNCLGADDTAGVWLAIEMIKSAVPGLYVFHYGEEIGGVGSASIVRDAPELFDGIDYAIALDRAGSADVITHQAGDRSCSDRFALSLAGQLPSGYAPCDRGVYTDTAEYVGIIRECSNISVGYYAQHTPDERLDFAHLDLLRMALVQFDEAQLVCERTAGATENTWPDDPWNDDRDFDRAYADDRAHISDREIRQWYDSLSEYDQMFVDYLTDYKRDRD